VSGGLAADPGTVGAVRSWQLLVERFSVNGVEVGLTHGAVIVVLREGDDEPGPTDWEASVRSTERQQVAPGTYVLRVDVPDGSTLEGTAMLRFSDGHRHLFRGDGTLVGFDSAS
jgi:hypothetical protein